MGDSWTLEELAGAGWAEADLDWETTAAEAMARLAASEAEAAQERFARLVRIATAEFATDDPRLGTSLANHGAALVAAGEAHLSGRTLKDAAAVWNGCDRWIARMTAPRVARSSLFHLRMELRHRPAYEARWRVKWAALAAEARGCIGPEGPIILISAAEAQERAERWERERPALLNDTRKLMAAVILLAGRRGGASSAVAP